MPVDTIIRRVGLRSTLAVAVASAALAGCGSSSNESSGGGGTVNLSGGAGGSGIGGAGGGADYFEIEKYTGAGDVVVKNSGSADASFVVHTATAGLGAVPLVISSNTDLSATMLVDCTGTPPSVTGTPYMVAGQWHIYKADGNAIACESGEIVTGLQVDAGATLTLGLSSVNGAYFLLANDIDNRGVITVADFLPTQKGWIDMEPGSYIGSGSVLAAGAQPGQNGGSIYISARYAVLNSGAMDASGADAAAGSGGNAGYVYLGGHYYTQNTGALKSNGGAGGAGNGGGADYVELYTDVGAVLNSGALSAQGGKGTTGGGGGGDVYLDHSWMGETFNSGDLAVAGGDATVNGGGGSAGSLYVYGYGGEIRNSGRVLADGGMAAGAGGSGGGGGYLDIEAYDGDCGHYDYSPVGNITWSGTISMKGGDAVAAGAGHGGGGGSVYAYADSYYNCTPYTTSGSTISFLGYDKLQLNGGAGDQGGNGYNLYLYNYAEKVYNNGVWLNVPGGNIEIDAAYEGRGGDAVANGASTNGSGGAGADDVYIETDYASGAAAQAVNGQAVKVNGNWDISGGKNRNATGNGSGYGGYAWVWGYDGVAFNGNIKADGGADIGNDGGTDGYGGSGYDIYLYAETGPVTVGSISASGGDGEYAGGTGAYVDLLGTTITATSIHADGGNAVATLANSVGGNGGTIKLEALNGSTLGAAGYKGGTGATAGTDGYLWANNCQGTGC